MKEKQIVLLLILGNILFAAFIAYLYLTASIPEVTDQARQDALTMSLFNGGFLLFATVITGVMKNAKKTPGKNHNLLPLIIGESSGFLGLVILIMSVNTGVIHEQPLIWLNAITSVIFLVIAARFITDHKNESPSQNGLNTL